MQTYSLREIGAILSLSRAVISGFIASGFVTPSRGKKREYRFTFQDLVLLRTAQGLQAAHIPPRKILQSLRRLRATLPEELPLTGLRITAVGNEVAVREGAVQRQVDTGQLLMDFGLAPSEGTVAVCAPAPKATAAGGDPDEAVDWFQRGVELEGTDPRAAEQAYRRAIAQAPANADPVLNLGVMLGDAQRFDEAIALYRQALVHNPDQHLLHFNLAVALEDSGQLEGALASYEHCTRLAPKFADAHFNAARLHEQLGHATKAIRHYSEYRRLQS
jgi:tetratricopeptide (TPR) repeat protein